METEHTESLELNNVSNKIKGNYLDDFKKIRLKDNRF
jgi:hypothetical protein